MGKKWIDVNTELPQVTERDPGGDQIRSFVEVRTEKGLTTKCQFRKWYGEPGGAFCGFPDTGEVDGDIRLTAFGETWQEFHIFGATSFFGNVSLPEEKRFLKEGDRIVSWRPLNNHQEAE